MANAGQQLNSVDQFYQPVIVAKTEAVTAEIGNDPKTRDANTGAMKRDMATDPMFGEKSTDPKMRDTGSDAWKRDGAMQSQNLADVTEQPAKPFKIRRNSSKTSQVSNVLKARQNSIMSRRATDTQVTNAEI